MRKIVLISFLIFGCAKSEETKAPTVSGTDLSGTWLFNGVQCFNSSLTSMTSSATISNGFSEQVVISGNTYTAIDAINGCTVNFAGDIVATSTGITLSNRRITSATGGSCAVTLNLSGGSITPASSTTMYSSNQIQATISNQPYIYNSISQSLGLPSTYSNGVSGNVCFVFYQKQ